MPIYAYRCESCGFAQDMLRKISDPPLSICPECGKDAFRKQVTAAGFQLKGSGWYVTDFRNNGSGPSATGKSGGTSGGSNGASDTGSSASSGTGSAGGDSSSSSASSGSSAGTAASPAPSSGAAGSASSS